MITVETRPERLGAIQWHKPGDAEGLGEVPYKLGTEVRYGIHSAAGGLQRLAPGHWIVLGLNGSIGPRVFDPAEFNRRFVIVEEAAS